jgi:hypothetical protein
MLDNRNAGSGSLVPSTTLAYCDRDGEPYQWLITSGAQTAVHIVRTAIRGGADGGRHAAPGQARVLSA